MGRLDRVLGNSFTTVSQLPFQRAPFASKCRPVFPGWCALFLISFIHWVVGARMAFSGAYGGTIGTDAGHFFLTLVYIVRGDSVPLVALKTQAGSWAPTRP